MAGKKKTNPAVRLGTGTYGRGAYLPVWPHCGVCKGSLVIELGAGNTWAWKCPACGVNREPDFS